LHVDGGAGDAALPLRLLDRETPDVAVFQEWRQQDAAAATLGQLGWEVAEEGGLGIATRFGAVERDERSPRNPAEGL
jgi:hypothetical protein